MEKIKAEITAKGTVQKVGYRDHVQETARNLNVKGYVENLRDGSVRIVCETDENTLKKFIKLITIKEDLIAVENIKTAKTQPATGEYEYFDIKYGPLEEEMGERMVAAFKIASATHQDMKSMHKELKGSIQDMHHDLKSSTESMHKDLKESIDSMHTDQKSMHKDLKESIDSMNQDIKGSIQSMNQDINQNFQEMAQRYGAISAELLRTREELTRAVDNLVEVIQKFLEKPT